MYIIRLTELDSFMYEVTNKYIRIFTIGKHHVFDYNLYSALCAEREIFRSSEHNKICHVICEIIIAIVGFGNRKLCFVNLTSNYSTNRNLNRHRVKKSFVYMCVYVRSHVQPTTKVRSCKYFCAIPQSILNEIHINDEFTPLLSIISNRKFILPRSSKNVISFNLIILGREKGMILIIVIKRR